MEEKITHPATKKVLTKKEWCDRLGMPTRNLDTRLRRGWTLVEALDVPLRVKQRLLTNPDTGETLTKQEWCKKLGITVSTLNRRLDQWTLREALNTPNKKLLAKQLREKLIVNPTTGESKTKIQWCEYLGISEVCFDFRLSYGWSLERILNTPNTKLQPSKSNSK